jgi:hypothetical protein
VASGYGAEPLPPGTTIGPDLMTARRALKDMIDPTARQESIESSDAHEAIEPTERIEPTEPIDSTDPLEPIESSECSDHSDHFELSLSGRMPPILNVSCGRTLTNVCRRVI